MVSHKAVLCDFRGRKNIVILGGGCKNGHLGVEINGITALSKLFLRHTQIVWREMTPES